MDKEKIQNYIEYLKAHPEKYVEMVTGHKTPFWQKIFIRMIDKIETRKNKGKIVYQIGGNTFVSIPTKRVVVRGNRSKCIYPVYFDEIEGDSDEV